MTPTAASLLQALFLWAPLAATPAGAWTVHVPSAAGAAPPIAADRRGNVLVALFMRGGPRAIAKLAGDDGSTVWSRRFEEEEIGAIVVSPAGRTFVAGRAADGGMLVERLSRVDGRTRWRSAVPSLSERGVEWVNALAVDGRGDVIAAGHRANAFALARGYEFAVMKLAGDSGALRWHFWIPGGEQDADSAQALVIDANDDVIAGGESGTGGLPSATVVKLRGADRALLWRRDIALVAGTRALALDAAGNVLVAVRTTSGWDFRVYKLSGRTGETLWEFNLSRSMTDTDWEEAAHVIALPAGDAIALGVTTRQAGRSALTAVRLDGATGHLRWRRLLRGTPGYQGGPELVALPGGTLVVGGQTRCRDIMLARLSTRTGRVLGRVTIGDRSASGCDRHADTLGGIVADGRGHIVVAGSLSDDAGRGSGFVTRLERLP